MPSAKDGQLVARLMAGIDLPLPLPGEPQAFAIRDEGERVALDLLDALSGLYGIGRWDPRTFEREFIGRAMRAWRPDGVVGTLGDEIVFMSRRCPLAERVTADPRVCEACQAVQDSATRLATGRGAQFDSVMRDGRGACVAVFPRGPGTGR
ncbi:MAG: hypothetical protein ACYDCK_11460 [Thermoplasmatota archaeon]